MIQIKVKQLVAPKWKKKENVSDTKVKLSWNVVKNVDGYQIQMSNNKKDGFTTIKMLKGGELDTYTVSNLKDAKKCYFRIRAYRVVDQKKVYGSFSKVK